MKPNPKSPKIIVEYKNIDIQILDLHVNILLLTKKGIPGS